MGWFSGTRRHSEPGERAIVLARFVTIYLFVNLLIWPLTSTTMPPGTSAFVTPGTIVGLAAPYLSANALSPAAPQTSPASVTAIGSTFALDSPDRQRFCPVLRLTSA